MALGTRPADIGISRSFAAILGLIGLVLLGGGTLLVTLNGSAYYLFAGVAFLWSGLLVWRGSRYGAAIYTAFLLVTLCWALWEVGADGWALAPRLIAPAVLGLIFATPWLRRSIGDSETAKWMALAPPSVALLSLLVFLGVAIWTSQEPAGGPPRTSHAMPTDMPGEWPAYGRTLAGDRFAPLDKISPANVDKLGRAWTYHTRVAQANAKSGPEATPIMVGDSLYLCTQNNIVIALDPDTGNERWRFDPQIDATGASAVTTCRGVAFYRAPGAKDCPERIITATFNAKLIALDAGTGKPCSSFGNEGFVELKSGMGNVQPGFYYVSSAPTIVGGNVVVGGWVADNQSTDEPSGVVRAFSADTGRFVWAWDVGRPGNSGEPGPGEPYTRSTPNSWAPMSADEKLGLVYIPTGNPTPDHWGGHRSAASEKYGSAIVALDAGTGKVRWSYQTAHHDLWDYDVASQPTLLDVSVGGHVVPAVIQATKRGELFLLDRRTGTLLARVEERPAPQRGAVADEHLSPTQPFSVDLPSFGGGRLTEVDMWGLTPLDQLWCRIEFRRLRYDGPATPPGLDRSLIYPSIGGGMNWGGVSLDPERDILIINSLYYGPIVQLVPRAEADRLLNEAKSSSHSATNFALPLPMKGTPYGARLAGLMSPLDAMCNKPPYGMLSAVDLRTNKLLWSRPIGSARDAGPFRVASHLPIPMGMPMFGGSLTTRSGLVFIGATQDRTLRAFDINSGRLLWSSRLPAGGQANPMTYVSPKTGRQYVVIYAGGHVLLRSQSGDAVVAYALPEQR